MTIQFKENAPVNWPAAITLYGTFVAAVTMVPTYAYFHDFSAAAWVSFVILAILNGLGITAGYHRLWAHRAYKANVVVRFLLLLFGTMATQNSVYHWASGHRRHHRHVDDRDRDPYAATRGFWFSHIGWMVRDHRSNREDFSNIPDLLEDKMLAFQHKHYAVLALASNFGLAFLLGFALGDVWGVVLLGGLLRLVWAHHTTFLINSLAHIWGRRPYTDENTARDNDVLAFFTYGEGYHNFHHIFQSDYRNGIRWYQFDPTKWLIRTLAFFGLASDLRRTPEFKIEKARLAMQFKRAESKLNNKRFPCLESMEQAKQKLAQEYETFSAALQEWARVKEQQFNAAKQALGNIEAMKTYKAQLHRIEQQLKAQRKRVTEFVSQLPAPA